MKRNWFRRNRRNLVVLTLLFLGYWLLNLFCQPYIFDVEVLGYTFADPLQSMFKVPLMYFLIKLFDKKYNNSQSWAMLGAVVAAQCLIEGYDIYVGVDSLTSLITLAMGGILVLLIDFVKQRR